MNQKTLGIPLIILLLGFPQISETIYTPSLPQITQDLQTTAHLTEMTLSIYFIGFALGVLVWGYATDRIGRRRSMLLGIALYSISCLVLWQTKTIESLLFWRIIQAFGASVGSVVTQTMLRDLYEGKKRHQIFALVSGALAFVPALGPLLGSELAAFFGWEANFLFLSLLGLFLLLCCLTKLPETQAACVARYPFAHVAKKMLKDRSVLTHVFLIALCNGIIFGFYGEAPFLFINLMQIPLQYYGLFGLVLCVAGLFASFLAHRLNEHYTPQEIIFGASFCTLFGAIILCSASFGNFFHPQATVLELCYIVMGIGCTFLGIGLTISNSLSIALTHYQETAGTAGSIFGLLYYVGIALFMGIVSFLHNEGPYLLPLSFLAYALGMLFCAIQLARKPTHNAVSELM